MLLWITLAGVLAAMLYLYFVRDEGQGGGDLAEMKNLSVTAAAATPRTKRAAAARPPRPGRPRPRPRRARCGAGSDPAPRNAPAQAAAGPGGGNLPPLPIFFGSQTGTAEMLAQRLAEEAGKHGFAGRAVDLEGVGVDDVRAAGRAVFLVATYGEGDPTDSAADFFREAEEAAADPGRRPLEGVPFAVFGLGNTQYENFNAAGRALNAALAGAGAARAAPYGEGDDAGSMDEDFEAWCDELWPALRERILGVRDEEAGAAGPAAAPCPAPPLRLCWLAEAPRPPPLPRAAREAGARPAVARERVDPRVRLDFAARHYFAARPVLAVRRCELRCPLPGAAAPEGSTLHVELDVGDRGIRYRPADVLAVLPENGPGDVDALLCRLGADGDAWFTLREWGDRAPAADADADGAQADADADAPPKKPPFPLPCSVREALARYCDLAAPPRRELLALLAHHAADADERARLLRLASRAGADEYRAWVAAAKRGTARVLTAFPSCRPPLGALLQLMPRLQPRLYTIASSPLAHPRMAHVVASVVTEPHPCGGTHRGVCTHHFARLAPALPAAAPGRPGGDQDDVTAVRALADPAAGDVARVVFKKSTFSQPPPSAPLLLVGAGTGVAPLRAFLQHRAAQSEEQRVRVGNTRLGDTHLFFGCRHERADFLYAGEFADLRRRGILTSLHTAFSRSGPRRVYVQHRLREQAALVHDALASRRGYLFVCGGTAMGKDVQHAVEAIFQEQGGLSKADAASAVKEMHRHGRYVAELWS